MLFRSSRHFLWIYTILWNSKKETKRKTASGPNPARGRRPIGRGDLLQRQAITASRPTGPVTCDMRRARGALLGMVTAPVAGTTAWPPVADLWLPCSKAAGWAPGGFVEGADKRRERRANREEAARRAVLERRWHNYVQRRRGEGFSIVDDDTIAVLHLEEREWGRWGWDRIDERRLS
jgi:hypothetical protein